QRGGETQAHRALLDRVAPPLQAGGARVAVGGHAGVLLLLGLLRALAAALAAPGDRAHRGTGLRVVGHDLAHHRAARRAAHARAGLHAGGAGGRRRRRRGRVVLALLHGPAVALAFVGLLLLRRLALGGIDELLGGRRRAQQRRGTDHGGAH